MRMISILTRLQSASVMIDYVQLHIIVIRIILYPTDLYCIRLLLMCWLICFVFSYDEGDVYGRPPMPPPGEMWGYRPPFDVPFDPRWGRGMPPPFMPPPPDFRLPVNCSHISTEVKCFDWHFVFVIFTSVRTISIIQQIQFIAENLYVIAS